MGNGGRYYDVVSSSPIRKQKKPEQKGPDVPPEAEEFLRVR